MQHEPVHLYFGQFSFPADTSINDEFIRNIDCLYFNILVILLECLFWLEARDF